MKSRTSFFNTTVLKKDITRFAPVWGLYIVFLIVLFLTGQRENTILSANAVANMLSEMSILNLVYGGLCANLLFGDLFQSRMCNALHTLPLRRTGWFCTHTLAGLLFCVIPNAVATLLLTFLLQEFYYLALLWFAVTVLQFLFFFGLGIFSVMCAGNRLGMAAVYMIINLFPLLVYVLVKEVYEPLLYGFEFVLDTFQFFCPVAYLTAHHLLSFNYEHMKGQPVNGHISHFYPEIWIYLFVTVAVGVVLILLALLLYRKRKLECVGDFLAFRSLSPVFLLICTLGCGVFFFALSSLFGLAVDYGLMALGVVVGFFAGAMLLERTVRVFHKKNFLRFAILALLLTVSLFLTKADPLGVTWYAPETDEIAAMRVYRNNERQIYEDMDQVCYQLESPEDIATFRQVHLQLMEERHHKTDGVSHMYILYKLKNGREVKRYYSIDENTAAYDVLRTHFSNYQYLFNVENWSDVTSNVTTVDLSLNYEYPLDPKTGMSEIIVTPDRMPAFLEAIRLDAEAGTLAQAHTFHVGQTNIAWCYLSSNLMYTDGVIIQNGNFFRDLNIYSDAVHLNALIEKWVAELETNP